VAAIATGIYSTTYRQDFALRRTRAEWIRLALIGVALVAVPQLADAYWMNVINQMVFFGIAVVGLMVLTGYTGLISLGTAGFMASGAYTTANVVQRLEWAPVPLGIVAGVLVSALLGAIFGLPALRLKGLYLAIATLASQYIIVYTARNWDWLTEGHGNIGGTIPSIGDYKLRSDYAWYWIGVVVLGLCVIGVRNLFRTGMGRAFIAIRDQDIAAEVAGVHVGAYKVLAFAIAAGFAGLGGALQAHYPKSSVVTWERYELEYSFLAVAMIIIGGLGSVAGAIYGAVFMEWLRGYITKLGQELQGSVEIVADNVPALQVASFGLVIVLFLLFEPRGLHRMWQRVKDYFRLWPFRY
jgi:branched-chain amino acid transport system permease protein